MPLPAWIQKVGKVAGAIFPTVAGIFQGGQQRRASRDAWNRTVAHEQKIWERDAAYNSPAAQMQRLKDANLNPNLMYGQGNVGNTTGSAQRSESEMQGVDIVGTIMQAMLGMKQLEVASQEIQLKAAQTEKVKEETGLTTVKGMTEQQKFANMSMQLKYLQDQYPDLMKQLKLKTSLFEDTYESQVDAARLRVDQIETQIQSEMIRQGLMEQDGKIKAEVLRSKEFMNRITEIMANFTEGKDMPMPVMLRAFMQLLLKSM